MSPRNEVFQAIPFDVSYDANEPLIAAGDAEEEDHQLEEKAFSRFKLSSLLLGVFVAFFVQFSALGANYLVMTLLDEDLVTKSKTDIVVISRLCSFFTMAVAIVILELLRNLVTITYSAVGGRSADLLEEMVWHMECRFVVGAMGGVFLAWTITDVLSGMRAHAVYSLVGLFWCKFVVMCFAAYSKPSSSRRSTAEQTISAF
jgi:hypothetical protein